ncbi:hypothetical protein CDL12_27815 [Handroanthus impetiginosus]|uniref:Uncharacterized protein n=1 Tax=Handroanthus impetiginosus TaxID=429701 RepID=A0A2G9G301_9LAMI|nr:hypothetical protein CDL12_27815 [Handroanthus impetiginosus]
MPLHESLKHGAYSFSALILLCKDVRKKRRLGSQPPCVSYCVYYYDYILVIHGPAEQEKYVHQLIILT